MNLLEDDVSVEGWVEKYLSFYVQSGIISDMSTACKLVKARTLLSYMRAQTEDIDFTELEGKLVSAGYWDRKELRSYAAYLQVGVTAGLSYARRIIGRLAESGDTRPFFISIATEEMYPTSMIGIGNTEILNQNRKMALQLVIAPLLYSLGLKSVELETLPVTTWTAKVANPEAGKLKVDPNVMARLGWEDDEKTTLTPMTLDYEQPFGPEADQEHESGEGVPDRGAGGLHGVGSNAELECAGH